MQHEACQSGCLSIVKLLLTDNEEEENVPLLTKSMLNSEDDDGVNTYLLYKNYFVSWVDVLFNLFIKYDHIFFETL